MNERVIGRLQISFSDFSALHFIPCDTIGLCLQNNFNLMILNFLLNIQFVSSNNVLL